MRTMIPSSFHLVAIALLAFVASGCIYIPGEGEKPFAMAANGTILPGKMDRTDVLATFGDPRYRYLDDRLFAYYGWQYKGVFFIGYGFSGTGGVLSKNYYLLVEFDDAGRVKSADRITREPSPEEFDDRRCSEFGFCLLEASSSRGLPLVAPPALDAKAKGFEPDPAKCVVYIAVSSAAQAIHDDLVLDNRQVAQGLFLLKADIYYRRTLSPGRHTLRLDRLYDSPIPEMPLSFDCAAGDQAFFKVATPGLASLRRLTPEDGRKAVQDRKLVLEPIAARQ